jgi:hypothetical protein
MPNLLLILTAVLTFSSYAATSEKELLKKCHAQDLEACLELTGHFTSRGRWDEALAMGSVLCKKNMQRACTYAGTAALAKGAAKIGYDLLSLACDGFEPFACQSLSDIAKKTREEKMRYSYQKRACYFGLSTSCKDLRKPNNFYSSKGQDHLTKLISDCESTDSESCKVQLHGLAQCPEPLTKEDCFFIPGDLSIVFRAKLIQKVAKLVLIEMLAAEKNHLKSKGRYTYDFSTLNSDKKSLTSSKYVIGFQIGCTKKYEDGKAQSTSLGVYPQEYQSFSEQTKRTIMAFFKKEKGDACFNPSVGFKAYAVGKLDPLNPTKLDIWNIDKDGELYQVQNGLP